MPVRETGPIDTSITLGDNAADGVTPASALGVA
jgi:hypothetical protein